MSAEGKAAKNGTMVSVLDVYCFQTYQQRLLIRIGCRFGKLPALSTSINSLKHFVEALNLMLC